MIKYSSYGVSLGTEWVQVLPPDNRRRGMIIQNNSVNTVYFAFNNALDVDSAFQILNTQTFTLDQAAAQNDVFMKASVAGSKVVIGAGTEVEA
jgi:hypothetical protein